MKNLQMKLELYAGYHTEKKKKIDPFMEILAVQAANTGHKTC